MGINDVSTASQINIIIGHRLVDSIVSRIALMTSPLTNMQDEPQGRETTPFRTVLCASGGGTFRRTITWPEKTEGAGGGGGGGEEEELLID